MLLKESHVHKQVVPSSYEEETVAASLVVVAAVDKDIVEHKLDIHLVVVEEDIQHLVVVVGKKHQRLVDLDKLVEIHQVAEKDKSLLVLDWDTVEAAEMGNLDIDLDLVEAKSQSQ